MNKPDQDRLDRVVAEARRNREQREQQYREQALKIYPWICGRCAREFTRQNLRQLTVHHRDHNHDNNPPDGSNWELLCLYCHDNEHARYLDSAGRSEPACTATTTNTPGTSIPQDVPSLVVKRHLRPPTSRSRISGPCSKGGRSGGQRTKRQAADKSARRSCTRGPAISRTRRGAGRQPWRGTAPGRRLAAALRARRRDRSGPRRRRCSM